MGSDDIDDVRDEIEAFFRSDPLGVAERIVFEAAFSSTSETSESDLVDDLRAAFAALRDGKTPAP